MGEFIKYRLTKKKAIEITIELWKWLEENPKLGKSAWPKWKKYGIMAFNCPCCEYTEGKTDKKYSYMDCEKFCPLIEIWPYEKTPEYVPCEDPKSPYSKWDDNDTSKAKYARELWMSAQKILEGKK